MPESSDALRASVGVTVGPTVSIVKGNGTPVDDRPFDGLVASARTVKVPSGEAGFGFRNWMVKVPAPLLVAVPIRTSPPAVTRKSWTLTPGLVVPVIRGLMTLVM